MNFLNVLIENYEAAKRASEEDFAGTTKKEAVLEIYKDLISIYKTNNSFTVNKSDYDWLMLNRPLGLPPK